MNLQTWSHFWLSLCNLKPKNIMIEITSSTAHPPLSPFDC